MGSFSTPQALRKVRHPGTGCCLLTEELAGAELAGAWWMCKGAIGGDSDEQQHGREEGSRGSRREEKDKALAIGWREHFFFPQKNSITPHV